MPHLYGKPKNLFTKKPVPLCLCERKNLRRRKQSEGESNPKAKQQETRNKEQETKKQPLQVKRPKVNLTTFSRHRVTPLIINHYPVNH